MPKGNVANLKPIRSTEEAREKGRKGGIKSGQVRSFKAHALEQTDEKKREAIINVILEKAMAGDAKMIELLLSIVGEKPVEVLAIESNEIRVTIDD